MRNPLLVSFLALVLSLVGIFVTLTLGTSSAADGGGDDRPAATPQIDLLGRIDALASENQKLRSRLSSLELKPAPKRAPASGFVSQETFEAFQEEVRAALSAEKPLLAKSEGLEKEVAVVLDTIRRDEAYAQAVRDHEKQEANVDGRIRGWSNWLELDQGQEELLVDILAEQSSRNSEVLRAWEEGADTETIEAMRASARQDHFRSVRAILSPEQAATMGSKFGDEEDDD